MGAVVGAVRYCSVEDVLTSTDTQYTARVAAQILRDIESHTAAVEGYLHRKFWPCVDTRYWNWPYLQYAWPETLHLEQDECISLSSLSAGGTAIPASNYQLEPRNSGPPYTSIELDLSKNSSFGGSAGTWQWNIQGVGVFGATNATTAAGTLAAAITDTTSTTVTVSDGSLVGTGLALVVDSEYMVSEGRSMVDTAATLSAGIAALASVVSVPVSSGALVHVGEVILVDSERMLVTDVAGNNAIVKRAWDGTVLAAHSLGAKVYAPRALTVVRGCWGTTAATHSLGAAVSQHLVPALVRDLTIAEVMIHEQWMSAGGTDIMQRGGVGGRSSSGKGMAVPMGAAGLESLRQDARARYGRKARTRSI